MRKIKFEIGKITHVYNRGVEKRDIFISDSDMWRFIQGMFLFNDEDSSFGVLSHVERENKGRINFNLLREFINKKYSRVGGLFQGRFKAVVIENDIHLQYVLAYINIINPGQLIEPELKEKGVIDIDKVMNFAESYSFSTNPDYLGLRDSII